MISHPLGKAWHEKFKAGSPEEIPLPLPDEAMLQDLCRDLPLRVRQLVEEEDLYMALLQVSCLSLPSTSHPLCISQDVKFLPIMNWPVSQVHTQSRRLSTCYHSTVSILWVVLSA